MLSNCRAPKYYSEFREQVLAGKIPVCKTIEMEMNRIDALIANPNYFYDDCAVDGFVKFCENEMTLRDGTQLKLLPSFKLWAEQVFCWYYYEFKEVPRLDPVTGLTRMVTVRKKHRLVRKQYLIVARGAAKSMYASLLHAYFLAVDMSTTQQITVAPTVAQADEVMAPIRTALARSRGPWFNFLTAGSLNNTTGAKVNRPKMYSSKAGIVNTMTESSLIVRPLSIDKLQGLGCKVATLDEWLSGEIREDPIGAIEQGATKVPGYLIVAISSEGTIRNGVGDTIKIELMDILRGDYENPYVSIWYYQLDDISEVGDPNMWMKANPNIGITVSYEAYQLDVERMEAEPSTRNDILAKRFGIPMEGYTYFFTYEETLVADNNRKFDWDGRPCSLGADLSQGDDFCAFTFFFPLGHERYGVKTLNYISEATLYALPLATREKYESFQAEGSLRIMPGTALKMRDVYDDLNDYILEHNYEVLSFGYDPYNADEFVPKWIQDNGPFGVNKVIQGKRTESVPLGELKLMAHNRQILFDQSMMQYTMGNCIAIEDNNGNRMLLKRRHQDKIDSVAAMMDAYISYKLNEEEFVA